MKNLTRVLTLSALSALVLSASNAFADRFILDYNGQEFRGHNRVVQLKRDLQQVYPNINWHAYELETALVEAKSREGNGNVELVIGNSTQDRARVPGDPRGYYINRPHTYDRIYLENYGRNIDRRSDWRLYLSGNIKLNRVIIDAEPTFGWPGRPGRPDRPDRPDRPGRPGYGLDYINLGVFTADKFLNDTEIANADARGVVEVRLTGMDSTVEVRDVVVRYRNGQQVRLGHLTGPLYEGQRKRARIRQGSVDSVRVTATSPNLIGSRGEYRIELGVVGRRGRR